MKKVAHIHIIAFVLYLFFFACKPQSPTAPDFPPHEELSMDFTYFTPPPDTLANYARAYQKVSAWKNILSDSLDIYNKFMAVIAPKKAIYQDKDTWLIKGTYLDEDKKYELNFFEIVRSDSVETKLFISRDSSYNNLLLFEGYFFPELASGYRQINKPDTGNTVQKNIKIEWHFFPNEKKEVKYTNEYLNSSLNGDYFLFKNTDESVFINIFEKSSDNYIYIEYNESSLEGRILDFAFFGDSVWHCWNAQKADIDCSE